MGILDFLKSKNKKEDVSDDKVHSKEENNNNRIADSSTVDEDERGYYQDDSYYTLVAFQGTFAEKEVLSFDKRRKTAYPSTAGLYPAEILLLEYCTHGNYPKPRNGYPGFWWFEYGIRDVGHALSSLYERGYLEWMSKYDSLTALRVSELKEILSASGLSSNGKKANLIESIRKNIPEENIIIPGFKPKYKLTEIGQLELEKNGYVPYLHNHRHKTVENDTFGKEFSVWSINKLFQNGDATNWRFEVGKIEQEIFGVDMANADPERLEESRRIKTATNEEQESMRRWLTQNRNFVNIESKKDGDGYDEESRGIDFQSIGYDKEALVQYYISIGKKYDAPALYTNAAALLRKYRLYDEELDVLFKGKKVVRSDRYNEELERRIQEVKELMKSI